MKLRFYQLYSVLILLFLLSNSLFIKSDRDVLLYDETTYLIGGSESFSFSDTAVYKLQYKLLSHFVKNFIDRYFVNYQLLLLILGVSFIFLARSKKELILLVSFVVLLFSSRFVSDLWPFITILSSILLVWLYISFRSNLYCLSIFFCFLLVYTRVEFLYLYYLLFFLILYKTWLEKEEKYRLFSRYILYFIGLAIILIHNPSDGERSYVAFCQHYAVSKSLRYLYFADPWTTCETLLATDFGKAKGLLNLWALNPNHFAIHLVSNMNLFFKKMQELFLLPTYLFAILVILFLFFEGKDFFRLVFRKRRRQIANKLVLYFSLTFGLMAILVIFPRDHYVLQLFVPIVSLLIQNRRYKQIFRSIRYNKVRMYLGFSVLIFLLSFFYLQKAKSIKVAGLRNPCSNLYTIEVLRNLKLQTYNILGFDGSVCAYLPNVNCKYFQISEKNQNFDQFLKQNQINLVIISEHFDKEPKYKNDKDYEFFLSHSYRTKSGDQYELSKYSSCDNRKVLYKSEQ
ncbi:hypothetical protein JWG40_00235 [Leptospira sp. 201903074]|uniref:hypothetical protein n=1 Tax=Leptospira abararensis TaxID=2810036 RepID=UPI0019668D1D|nr:hypothetical protein [Leptospira abararensis]MBM9545427.1 hypothetical protein [Leptospira abararensis]